MFVDVSGGHLLDEVVLTGLEKVEEGVEEEGKGDATGFDEDESENEADDRERSIIVEEENVGFFDDFFFLNRVHRNPFILLSYYQISIIISKLSSLEWVRATPRKRILLFRCWNHLLVVSNVFRLLLQPPQKIVTLDWCHLLLERTVNPVVHPPSVCFHVGEGLVHHLVTILVVFHCKVVHEVRLKLLHFPSVVLRLLCTFVKVLL